MADNTDLNVSLNLMTRDEVRLYADRWRLVNDVIDEEIRKTPVNLRFQQLCRLFGTRPDGDDDPQVVEVRDRWALLKSRANV